MFYGGLDWDDDEEEEVVRFQYNFLYGRSQFEEERDFDRETHQSFGWKSVSVGNGVWTMVYEGLKEDPQYQSAMPAEEVGGYIYFLHAPEVGRVKIGYTTNPESRLSSLQTGSPVPVRIVKLIRGTRNDESRLHYRFRDKRAGGEWFEDSVLDDLARDV